MNNFRNLDAIAFLATERQGQLREEARIARLLRNARGQRGHTAGWGERMVLAVTAATLAAVFVAQSVLAAGGGGAGGGAQLLM
jgi:hypothetical protein